MKELKIDPELRDLLPPLTDDEYKQLEKNILENGFDKNFPIMEWNGFIVDGHNRYSICKKHNIEYVVGTLAYETKEEVMEWMLDIQLGRRNLSPIQRIAVAEKYRPIYEKQAKENQSLAGGDKKSESYKKSVTPNLVEAKNKRNVNNETNTKLAKIAGVKKETYRMGAKVLNSDDEELKQRVLSGETSISAGYKELQNEKKKNQNASIPNREYNNISSISISNNSPQKPIVENGVVLIDERTEDDKMMNDIARRMKSGTIDYSRITNETEINNIKKIITENIDSIISYVHSSINFDDFKMSDLNDLRKIINEATEKMENLIKNMEEMLNE